MIGRDPIVAHCFYYVSAIFGIVYVSLLVIKKVGEWRSKDD